MAELRRRRNSLTRKKSHLADGFDEATKDRPGREVVGDCGMMSQRLKERLKEINAANTSDREIKVPVNRAAPPAAAEPPSPPPGSEKLRV